MDWILGLVTTHPILIGIVFILYGIEKILEFVGALKGVKGADNVGVILGNLVRGLLSQGNSTPK